MNAPESVSRPPTAAGSERDRAAALSQACTQAWQGGDLVAAFRAGREGAESWRDLDPLEASKVLCTLSLVCADLGAYGEAVQAAMQAFELAEQARFLPQMATAMNAVGVARHRIGDHAKGRACLLQALELAQELGEPDAIFSALNNLGASSLVAFHDHAEAGTHADAAAWATDAVSYARRAAELAETRDHPFRCCAALANLGEALAVAGDLDAAFPVLARAEAMAAEQRSSVLALHARAVFGDALVRAGQFPSAVEHLRVTLDGLRADGNAPDLLMVHAALRRALKALGRFEEALAHCEAVLASERRRATQRDRTLAAIAVSRSDLLRVRLDRARERARSTRFERQAREFEASALRDPLTGLGNRRHLDHLLHSLPAGTSVCMAMLDIDHFKQINDRFGHAVGDAVLRELGALLVRSLRDTDAAIRLGGEEFCLVLEPADIAVACTVAERVRAAIQAADWDSLAADLAVTASLGVAAWCGDAAQTLALADAALYEAKHGGRNRVRASDTD